MTSSISSEALRTTAWLARHLDDTGQLRVVDGSFHLPGSGRDPRAEYAAQHIPGARFFDIDGICDRASPLPHMLPGANAFAAAVGALGISNDSLVVVYDAPGSAAAARVWWTFRVFGHDRVAVLDGGLARWLAEGRPADGLPPAVHPARFTARFRPELVRSLDDMRANLANRREQVVDNRSPGRFAGSEPEPRPVRHSGHIPGSHNIPFNRFLDASRHGMWQPTAALRAAFIEAGIDLDRPVVASCGSGVTAAATAFAAFLLGKTDVAVYDGSWAEWGNRDDTPIEPARP